MQNIIENTKKLLAVSKPEWPYRSINYTHRILLQKGIYFSSAVLNIPFCIGYIKPEHTDLFSIFESEELNSIRTNPKHFFLFDYMREGTGYKNYNFYQLITQSAYKHNIPFNKIVFASSNLIEQQAYDNWILENSIKDKFHIFSCNFWAATFLNKTSIDETVGYLRAQYKKDFLCLNRRFRKFRFLSVFLLHKSKAFNNGLISFDSVNEGRFMELAKTLKVCYNIDFDIADFNQFRKLLPLILDRSNFEVNWVDTMPDELFHSTLYSLVNETIIEDVFENEGPSLFYSEKTFKPMFYNHPVLIFGQPNANTYLKNIGFKTYDSYFNLEFDTIINGYDRISAVIKEVERISNLLASLNIEQKIEWVLQDRQVLEHNQAAMSDPTVNNKMLLSFVERLEKSTT
jgi:hypothetical protein